MLVNHFNLYEVPTFPEYLRSGWEINLVVAIDFTASNGDPHNSDSLHYLGGTNQYEKAINAVGHILE